MKKRKYILLSILIIVCFLTIQISYNNTPSCSIFRIFWISFGESLNYGFDFDVNHFTHNLIYNLIELLMVSFFLILAASFLRKKLMIACLGLFLFLWSFWAYSYEGLIEMDLYIISSIPFFLSLILIVIFLIKEINIKTGKGR